jgi:hypothetical protein
MWSILYTLHTFLFTQCREVGTGSFPVHYINWFGRIRNGRRRTRYLVCNITLKRNWRYQNVQFLYLLLYTIEWLSVKRIEIMIRRVKCHKLLQDYHVFTMRSIMEPWLARFYSLVREQISSLLAWISCQPNTCLRYVHMYALPACM